MSANDVLSAWDQEVAAALPRQTIADQQPNTMPATANEPSTDKSMADLVNEKLAAMNSQQAPTEQGQPSDLSGPEKVLSAWNTDVGRSESSKYLESLSPEDFKTEFMDRMSTMDIGERTNIEKFLFGGTAKDANPLQAFLRGVRGELSETGLGAKQRIDDVLGGDKKTAHENEFMRQQIKQQTKTNYPLTTGAGEITGMVAEFAPLMATGAGAVPLLAEGAAYGVTRPQEKGYSGLDVAKSTGKEAITTLVGGKVAQKLIDIASPAIKTAYSKITGNAPAGQLIDKAGNPSDELVSALESQGTTYGELLERTGVFDEMKRLLKAQPVGVDAEQAVRAARYESLNIQPTKSSISQGFDDAVDSQVLRRQINDPEAAQLREALADESEGFKNALTDMSDSIGAQDGVGDSVRSALTGRMKSERAAKSEAYKKLAEEAEAVGESLPVSVNVVTDAWNQTKKIKRSQMSPLHSDVKESLMRFGVVEPDDGFKKLLKKGEEEITPLSVKNFENLRQELNANISPQDPATSAILKPIIKQLDETIDVAAQGAEKAQKLTDLSKQARGRARDFKREFDSKDMVNDILKTKKGTFDTYQIRGQDIYSKLIKTSRKQPTLQQLNEVMTSLEKAGPKGKRAIADMQSATIMNMLSEATSQLHAKGMKGQQFSYTAFRKAFDGIGDKEMKRLFSNNKGALNMLGELNKAAKDSQTFFDAIPRGSAADIQNMFSRSFAPLFEAVGFAKAGTLGRMAAQTLAEKATERVSKGKLRKAVAEEIKAKPRLRLELTKLSKQYPGVFEAIGIALSDKATKDDE